jgi:hypothetical protein
MPAQEQFGDVLERALAAAAEGGRWAAPPERRPHAGPPPVPPFSFAAHPHPFLGVAARCRSRFPCAAYGVPATAAPTRCRVPRQLSAAERRAANQLRRLGATGLDDDFSTADVKRAYRVLARRFHPDAHPDATDAERAYLADAFGRITTAYHELTRSS